MPGDNEIRVTEVEGRYFAIAGSNQNDTFIAEITEEEYDAFNDFYDELEDRDEPEDIDLDDIC